ncbi:DUF4345 domain-containing protein [Vibrio sp. Isolate30]|uniref:DUF4345 domain-containing protein n=1 Tax=Vibrio sp. Isolate30 TaxID=2908536 RepID=UPI001EFC371A|nr:DUF4345 domain-containing protein [Vibrio sp. Isolate30]MCG9630415.1 DUF4345 domain-containing protein [Vibrio sp. Isolate30]
MKIVTKFQRIVLGAAGFTAFVIGGLISLSPLEFYASYGVAIDSEPSLLSELRGLGANLAALGMLMIAGLFSSSLAKTSVVVAKVVFFAFPVGRMIGIMADGMPSQSILTALAIEIVFAVLLVVAFRRTQQST